VGAVHVSYYTDPACPYSWAAEPALRRLQVEFAEGLTITYVMGGLAREFRKLPQTMRHVHLVYDSTDPAQLRQAARWEVRPERALTGDLWWSASVGPPASGPRQWRNARSRSKRSSAMRTRRSQSCG
jgi:protein-disulfide isomerase-like protein with CxxC motif